MVTFGGKINGDFSRKLYMTRFPFFLRPITKISSSLEKYISLTVYFLNLKSVSDTVCIYTYSHIGSYIHLHPVVETNFRLKKYTVSEIYFSRELDILVIERKKNGNLLMYSFREKSTFIFSAKSWHFAFSRYPLTPCSSCFNFKLPF